MNLLRTYLKKCMKMSIKHNMKVRVIGSRERLHEDILAEIEELEEVSKDFTGLNFQIALNYGSRDEMIRAMKRMAADVKEDRLSIEEITAEKYSTYLDTGEIPDPDLLIRTSGEQRISNYLLWQLAYSELYFTPVPWPDFHRNELEKAVEAYASRDRRYGGVKEDAK
jgi:undecaprenyl diphosphate synthase